LKEMNGKVSNMTAEIPTLDERDSKVEKDLD
jgi:hypothetical protein